MVIAACTNTMFMLPLTLTLSRLSEDMMWSCCLHLRILNWIYFLICMHFIISLLFLR